MIQGYENKLKGGKKVRAGKDLYLTKDGRVVTAASKEAYALFARAHHRVPEAAVKAAGKRSVAASPKPASTASTREKKQESKPTKKRSVAKKRSSKKEAEKDG